MPGPKTSKKSDIWNPKDDPPLYGYHHAFPVPDWETKKVKAFKLNKVYSSPIRMKNAFLVICKTCNQTWKDRLPFYPFNKNHQKKKHKDTPKVFNIQIVSWLEIHETEYKFIKEWRLVRFRDLKYIQPKLPYYIDERSEPSIYKQSISNNILEFAGIKLCKKFWAPLQFTRLLLEYGYECTEYFIIPEQCVIPQIEHWTPNFHQDLMDFRWCEYNNHELNSHYPGFKIYQQPITNPQTITFPPMVTNESNENGVNEYDDDKKNSDDDDDDDIGMMNDYQDTQTQHDTIVIDDPTQTLLNETGIYLYFLYFCIFISWHSDSKIKTN